jgi:hypothetical protein
LVERASPWEYVKPIASIEQSRPSLLKKPTGWIPILVPSGAVVTVTHSPLDTLCTVVDVIWGNKAMTMLTADLRERATLIDLLSKFDAPLGRYRNSN